MTTPIHYIKDTVSQSTACSYESFSVPHKHELRLASNINQLIRDLSSLTKLMQEEVYIALRQTMKQSNFVTDYSGTHFAVNNMNDDQLLQLYNIVAMCLANQERNIVINQATQEMETSVNSLSQQLITKAAPLQSV